MTYNLQPSYPDVSELTTNDKAITVLYGRVPITGELVPIQIDSSGIIATSGGGGGGITPSSNAFFADQTGIPLTGTFVEQTFGFTSVNITLFNDDSTQVILFSFDGVHIHGRLNVGEGLSMDYRAQPGVFLRTVSGSAAMYRILSY